MKDQINLVEYKKNFFERFIDSLYIKLLKNRDIYKIFSKNSFFTKKPIVQEYAIDYLCANFEIDKLPIIWDKTSEIVKQRKYEKVKSSICNYIDLNLINFDEIISKLPNDFYNLKYQNHYRQNEFLDNLKFVPEIMKNENHNELFKSLTELKVILEGFDEKIINCIPKSFINFIEENYDRSYIPNINPLLNINKQKLLGKTKILLAIIYRKYMILL